jgi:hypothetical protein
MADKMSKDDKAVFVTATPYAWPFDGQLRADNTVPMLVPDY